MFAQILMALPYYFVVSACVASFACTYLNMSFSRWTKEREKQPDTFLLSILLLRRCDWYEIWKYKHFIKEWFSWGVDRNSATWTHTSTRKNTAVKAAKNGLASLSCTAGLSTRDIHPCNQYWHGFSKTDRRRKTKLTEIKQFGRDAHQNHFLRKGPHTGKRESKNKSLL